MQLNGLTSIQAQQQKEQGNINLIPEQSDRSTKQIIRANICTYFNLIFLIIFFLRQKLIQKKNKRTKKKIPKNKYITESFFMICYIL